MDTSHLRAVSPSSSSPMTGKPIKIPNCLIINLVERSRKEALEKGAKDEVDDGREASVGAGDIGKVSTQ